ncbi:MAG: ribonuclease HII [Clostridia bacterium]|nr:ribonuclease HII [Clostridia bacterium]
MARETAKEKLERMTQIEKPLWEKGLRVAGIDEVGRGPLAGPVVTACVVVDPRFLVEGVDDSKKLSEKKREALYDEIVRTAAYIGIGWVEPAEIDRLNILNATKVAMEQAGSECEGCCFLVDAMEGLRLPGEVRSIVHGDALSYAIAAASIVAKVTRDRYMIELDKTYPGYGFARNKGYGTAEHIRALGELGATPVHRRTFIGKFVR